MKNLYPPIFDICYCGKCNEIVYGGKKDINGHTWINRKHSDKTKQKMKENHADFSGEKHPRYGRHCSNETKIKLHNNKQRSNKISESRKKSHKCKIMYISTEWRKKQSESHKGLQCGKDNPNWRGGLSFLPYCEKFNEPLKWQIRERDNYQCQMPECLITQLESLILHRQSLIVHHVHYDKPNCNPDLITLCSKHNAIVNFNRDYWENLFTKMLKERGL